MSGSDAHAEHVLAELRRLQNTLDSLPFQILVTGTDYVIQAANRTYLDNNDLELSDVVGQRNEDLERRMQEPDPAVAGSTAADTVLKNGRVVSTVESRVDSTGREYFASIRTVPMRDKGGRVVGIVESTLDITERVETERALARRSAQLSETRQELQGILENSRDLIFLTDAGGRITSFNHGAETALGYATDEVVGTPVHALFQDPDELLALFDQALFEGHATLYEMELRCKDGETAICNVSLTTVDDERGETQEVVGICRDMTTRLRLRANLVRSDRLAAIGKVAAGVAHEINNPLAVIETITGVLEDTLEEEGSALTEDGRRILDRAVERLRHQVRRCSSVTHGLLGFARRSGSEREALDLTRLIESCLGLLTAETNLVGATIDRDYAENLPPIETDPMLLQQVFVNLIKNACDAIEEKGTGRGVITLRLHVQGNTMVMEIEDDGIGIEAQALDKIFDLFHTSKPVGKGTGLGLAIVHDIVVRLGGAIDVRSERGQWTRFRLSLPLRAGADT